MTKVNLMTRSEYAIHRGVSTVAVHKAIQSGRISLIDGRIDPDVADIQWTKNTRPRASRKAAEPPVEGAVAPGGLAAVSVSTTPDDYLVSRARRESAEAAMAELRQAELEGKLIRVDAIKAAMSRRVSAARDSLLQIPHRVASVLAAESDVERVFQVLEDEICRVLLELSRESEALKEA